MRNVNDEPKDLRTAAVFTVPESLLSTTAAPRFVPWVASHPLGIVILKKTTDDLQRKGFPVSEPKTVSLADAVAACNFQQYYISIRVDLSRPEDKESLRCVLSTSHYLTRPPNVRPFYWKWFR